MPREGRVPGLGSDKCAPVPPSSGRGREGHLSLNKRSAQAVPQPSLFRDTAQRGLSVRFLSQRAGDDAAPPSELREGGRGAGVTGAASRLSPAFSALTPL